MTLQLKQSLNANVTRPAGATSSVPAFVYCLALGTFAIGTEGYMIAPLLPRMALDFGRSISDVAFLITIFTLTLAVSSPVLTVLSAHHNRRRLLLAALGVFAVANVIAWSSSDFNGIAIARVLLAVAAGLYVPNASALAGALVAKEIRGSALAIVNGGTTIAVALGLPLGALVGNAFGWRMTFLAVGVMSLLAAVGVALSTSSKSGADLPVAGFGERLAVAGHKPVLLTLVLTLLWSTGVYTAYPMIAPYLIAVAKLNSWQITAMVSLWGVSAAIGVFLSGKLTDRFGSTRVMTVALGANALSFVVLTAVSMVSLQNPIPAIAFGLCLWGISAWGFTPALMHRLVHAGDAHAAPIALSLNYSTMFAGFSLGSFLGAKILATGTVSGIDAVAALLEIIAFFYFIATQNRTIGKAES